MFGLGPLEIGAIVLIIFLLFGPKRLPDLARSVGEGIREFKKSVTTATDEVKSGLSTEDGKDSTSTGGKSGV